MSVQEQRLEMYKPVQVTHMWQSTPRGGLWLKEIDLTDSETEDWNGGIVLGSDSHIGPTTDWSFVLHVLGYCDLITSSLLQLNCVCHTCMFCACQKRVFTKTHLNDSKTDSRNGGIVSYTHRRMGRGVRGSVAPPPNSGSLSTSIRAAESKWFGQNTIHVIVWLTPRSVLRYVSGRVTKETFIGYYSYI